MEKTLRVLLCGSFCSCVYGPGSGDGNSGVRDQQSQKTCYYHDASAEDADKNYRRTLQCAHAWLPQDKDKGISC